MYGLLVGFGLTFDKGQKQSSTLSCDSSYLICNIVMYQFKGGLKFKAKGQKII